MFMGRTLSGIIACLCIVEETAVVSHSRIAMCMEYDMKEVLNSCIESALDLLYQNDQYLVWHPVEGGNKKRSHVSERACVFRFGVYFDSLFREMIPCHYHIDVEYNRNLENVKTLPQRGTSEAEDARIPDLIVHQRGNNDNNLLIIEFKTWWNPHQQNDQEKIKLLMDEAGEYKYRFGVTVLFGKTVISVPSIGASRHEVRGELAVCFLSRERRDRA